ncbi:uncharacterized, partial [Tachysurus ichikawai]
VESACNVMAEKSKIGHLVDAVGAQMRPSTAGKEELPCIIVYV